MALRNIVKDGDPILKKVCRPVTDFNDRLGQLLDDMADTMLAYDGLGLAGPQVGTMRRLFIALDESSMPEEMMEESDDLDDEDDVEDSEDGEDDDMDGMRLEDWEPEILEFINPEIIEREEEELRGYEGCLSFPGQFGAIARPRSVKVRAFDRKGNPFEYEAEGMMARCLCHEIDHLNGVTIDDLAEYFYDPEVPHDLDESFDSERSMPNEEE